MSPRLGFRRYSQSPNHWLAPEIEYAEYSHCTQMGLAPRITAYHLNRCNCESEQAFFLRTLTKQEGVFDEKQACWSWSMQLS